MSSSRPQPQRVLIGGPESRLPRLVETALVWILAGICLAVPGYHYVKEFVVPRFFEEVVRLLPPVVVSLLFDTLGGAGGRRVQELHHTNNKDETGRRDDFSSSSSVEDEFARFSFLPLTTSSWRERTCQSPKERHDQLLLLLEHLVLLEDFDTKNKNKDVVEEGNNDEDNRRRRKTRNDGEKSNSGECDRERIEERRRKRRSADCQEEVDIIDAISDEQLVDYCRNHDICRRLASSTMRPYCTSTIGPAENNAKACRRGKRMTSILKEHPHLELPRRLARLWPQLLALPPPKSTLQQQERGTTHEASEGHVSEEKIAASRKGRTTSFSLSLIVPAYGEDGDELYAKLSAACSSCHDPQNVEVVIVDAGGCTKMDKVVGTHRASEDDDSGRITRNEEEDDDKLVHKTSYYSWGSVKVICFQSGGGRGPCLNYGASMANGRILTFLHADTVLPDRWDRRISERLLPPLPSCRIEEGGKKRNAGVLMGPSDGTSTPNSCAFLFDVDLSSSSRPRHPVRRLGREEGIVPPPARRNPPPGIGAVGALINFRTMLYSLPYGDQVLSLRSDVFKFLGGFPDQGLFEDYDLVDLLRARAARMPFYVGAGGEKREVQGTKEHVAVVDGPPVLCSPRRWEKLGVLYVMFMNYKFVVLYRRGMSPDDLFRLYYGVDPPPRLYSSSPWEVQLKGLLESNKKEVPSE